jgi:phosphate transport system substrate-binding protein
MDMNKREEKEGIRMKMKKIASISAAVMMAAAMLLAGCAASPTPAPATQAPTIAPTVAPTEAPTSEPTPAPLSGKLNLSGSTSMLELVEELAEKYMDINQGVTVDVQGGGSGVGIQNALDGVSDIGNSSSAMKQADIDKGLVGTVVAIDGVAVIVNKNNPLSDLTAEDIVKIFKGEVTNWKDVGGADHAITVVNREASSGTREAMWKLFGMASDADLKGTVEQNSTGNVITTVAGDEYAVGYISTGSVVDTIKALSVGGVAPTKANILNETYKYNRPFVMVTKGAPAGVAKEFIDWVVSDPEGIAIVGEKYIPISEKK